VHPYFIALDLVKMNTNNEDGWEDMIEEAIISAVIASNNLLLQMFQTAAAAEEDDEDADNRIDHRTLPRRARRQFKHGEALACLMRDYLGPSPLFGKEFDMMFRISRTRFQKLMEDVGNSGVKFYRGSTDAFGRETASLEARLLLPLKTLAYGVPPHCFCDYFQMSVDFSRQCCFQFDKVVQALYSEEFLRLPTKEDLKNISNLHKSVHGVDGMFGSLDCMHTYWKNCPKAWQGSFSGKEKQPTIVLEAISDHHTWFWHASYGYAGTLNDLNVLNLSPFLDALRSGKFAEIETLVVPYEIGLEEFKWLYILVDGIYPKYSRFVKGMKEPITRKERIMTAWQEGARKDIERAFGILQAKWQWIARPIHLHNLTDISNRVAACLILHNMLVSDRIMDGDVNARYNPSHCLEEVDVPVDQDEQTLALQETIPRGYESRIGVGNMRTDAARLSIDRDIWNNLKDVQEHARLHVAISDVKLSERLNNMDS
jgi:hypothetical protein